MISYDEENKNACLSLRQAEILDALANDEKLRKAGGGVPELRNGITYVGGDGMRDERCAAVPAC